MVDLMERYKKAMVNYGGFALPREMVIADLLAAGHRRKYIDRYLLGLPELDEEGIQKLMNVEIFLGEEL